MPDEVEVQRGIKVLLVIDDDALFVRELVSQLPAERFEVVRSGSYDVDADWLAEATVDVCLIDAGPGERNERTTLQEVLEAGAGVPMIVLTNEGDHAAKLAALDGGAARVLDKAGLTLAGIERAISDLVDEPWLPADPLDAEETALAPDDLPDSRRCSDGSLSPRILLIDDDEDDFLLTKDLLVDTFGPGVPLDWVASWGQALNLIREGRHDVYLVDYRLGERTGLELVREAVDFGCDAPFIVLTGEGKREIDIQAMRYGAADYLVKGEITAPLLDRAIRYSIERHRAERRLSELARTDQLTGLANRYSMHEFLKRALARADRNQSLVIVMLLDLDRFKIINDTHGHDAGDTLLKRIAERLEACVRESDLVARLGGDEFLVVTEGGDDLDSIAHLARRILDTVEQPIQLAEAEVHTSTSIGIAVYPTDASCIDELMASADSAMYEAKEHGPGGSHFYTMEMRIRAAQRLELESGIRTALEKDEFRVNYQPQIDLRTGQIAGFEALVRWQHPSRGLVPPSEFIPLAEESSLIVPLGELVLRSACAQMARWRNMNLPLVPVAVNFSARQFQHGDLMSLVSSALAEHGLDPSALEIEITESDILKSPERIRDLLRELAAVGVQVALDDFGTGFSSLNHLRTFPGASIKIDRSFISNICTDPSDAAIVRTLIPMAHSLRLKVIAEGVETREQVAVLRAFDCDMIQGFVASKPLAPDVIDEALFRRSLIGGYESRAADAQASPHISARSLALIDSR